MQPRRELVGDYMVAAMLLGICSGWNALLPFGVKNMPWGWGLAVFVKKVLAILSIMEVVGLVVATILLGEHSMRVAMLFGETMTSPMRCKGNCPCIPSGVVSNC